MNYGRADTSLTGYNGMTRLVERESGRVIVERLRVARSMSERMRGLLGRSGLPPGEGMLIERCSSIHTFFMKFSLDVIFLDRSFRVMRVVRHLHPWRLAGAWNAARVVELGAGALDGMELSEGRELVMEERP